MQLPTTINDLSNEVAMFAFCMIFRILQKHPKLLLCDAKEIFSMQTKFVSPCCLRNTKERK